jgi:hypothetical protein
MKHYLSAFLLFCLGLIVFSLPATAQDARHYTCYRTTGHIVADGVLNEPD